MRADWGLMPLPALPSPAPSAGSVSIDSILAVALGGAVGTAVRHGVATIGPHPSWTVLAVNVIGSFALGLVVAIRASGLTDRWTALVGIGFCGGLTTFSTHAVDLARRLDEQRWTSAFVSLAATTLLCVAAAALGHRLVGKAAADRST